jgi:hypothetical protein
MWSAIVSRATPESFGPSCDARGFSFLGLVLLPPDARINLACPHRAQQEEEIENHTESIPQDFPLGKHRPRIEIEAHLHVCATPAASAVV